jgi:6-phosphogluconolactonase
MSIVICRDADDLATHAADRFIRIANEAVAARGRFTVALAGGSTPARMYTLLAAPDRREPVDWSQVYLFFSDERAVPADDSCSNYGMAQRTLLAGGEISADHVFPVPTGGRSAAEAAAEYAGILSRFFGLPPAGPPPVFDLILLGLGDDGHTASLFPGKPALWVRDAWVTSSPPGILPPPVDRITFTFPVLNAARYVAFLVSGAKKATVVRAVLESGPGTETYPAADVRPTDGTLLWMLDDAAASLLSNQGAR